MLAFTLRPLGRHGPDPHGRVALELRTPRFKPLRQRGSSACPTPAGTVREPSPMIRTPEAPTLGGREGRIAALDEHVAPARFAWASLHVRARPTP